MHAGSELERLAKRAGGKLLSRKGHHSEWLVRGKVYRIATAGSRPSHLINAMGKALKRAVTDHERKQSRVYRKKSP